MTVRHGARQAIGLLRHVHGQGPAVLAAGEGTGRRREGEPVNPRESGGAPVFRLMERFADARSHPVQPCATIALLPSIPQDVHQLIRLSGLPGAYAHE